jgi:hypothetical protein
MGRSLGWEHVVRIESRYWLVHPGFEPRRGRNFAHLSCQTPETTRPPAPCVETDVCRTIIRVNKTSCNQKNYTLTLNHFKYCVFK